MSEDKRAALASRLERECASAAETTSRMSMVCALAVTQLSVTGAGATVLASFDGDGQEPRRGLVHATNDVSAGLEDLQLTVGEGPCLDTFTTGGPVLIPDLAATAERWPGFTPGARAWGAAAVFSFPLQVGGIRVGSLDCYHERPGSLSGTAISDGLILAELATQTVIAELEGHLSTDVSWLADPHAEVHQATGMVQVQLDTTTEAALLRLRAHAYTHELALTEVAHRVTTRRLHFDPGPDDEEPWGPLA